MNKAIRAALVLGQLLLTTPPALAGSCADVAAAYGKAMAGASNTLPSILDGWDGASGMPLSYVSDDGTVSANIACNPNRDVNTLRFELNYVAGGQDKALVEFTDASEAFGAALDPQAKLAEIAKSAASDAAKSGKGNATAPLGEAYSASFGARQEADGSGKLTFLVKPR